MKDILWGKSEHSEATIKRKNEQEQFKTIFAISNFKFPCKLGSKYLNLLDTDTIGDSLSEQILSKLVWIPRPLFAY